ncbi:hypothetical protein HPB52_025576 [Rhipicephalus sanguineus]|uniref:Sulfotransferase domain-containing protein n=1 Tax=Rhipicephalus sanguineus TaxID=34632 RepID=A0A9D4YRC2_RHISA|nr:hypothetical protein HPB52_025576 [Rhipicephalus sanguineus]
MSALGDHPYNKKDASKHVQTVDGFLVNDFLHDDNVSSALTYTARPDDIFVVSYPKCGTTWTQYIVFCVLNKGQPPEDYTDFMLRSPFLELLGAESAHRTYTSLGIPTTAACPTSTTCETRPSTTTEATLDEFVDVFVEGKVSCGDYFNHLIPWYEHRNDENVLLITYERLKEDTGGAVLDIADFLGNQYGEELRRDTALFTKITDWCAPAACAKPSARASRPSCRTFSLSAEGL